jgi:glycosyltransferase involved in cell wall biosynthesis
MEDSSAILKTPKVSVVVPTLNEERDLPLLLDALDAQTFRDFEVIVADAGSPDRTCDIAHARDCRIVNGGLPAAGRNAGAAAAQGEWLLFFDADVAPRPEFLARALAEAEERGLDIATCPAEPRDRNLTDAMLLTSYNAYVLMTQHFWPHAPGFCILVRRDLHVAMGGFDETIHVAEDADYAKRAAKRGKFGMLVSVHIPVSTRRFSSDGRFTTSIRYVTWDLHSALFGEITREDGFTYEFGHHNATEPRMKLSDFLQHSPVELFRRYADVVKRQKSLFE